MTRMQALRYAIPLVALLWAFPLPAQTVSAPSRPATTTGRRPVRGRHQPCWQQAGVSQSVIQQHRAIEEDIRSQVESVCSDSSLTPQQRAAKVRSIREEGRQRQAALLTSEQRSALEGCRAQRGERGTGMGGVGPCGASVPRAPGRKTTAGSPTSEEN
jgi:hypothetical protein